MASKERTDVEQQRTAAAAATKPSLARAVVLVSVCTTAMIVNVSNTTSVAIALPTIGEELGIQQDQLQWLTNAYSLSSGCLLLMFGRIADLYGRKKTFIIGLLWLLAFGIACGLVNDSLTLQVLRGLQGVGGAAIIPAALGILARSFPPSRARAIAFATFGAGAPVGGAIGTLIGGALTQYTKATWRSSFYLSAGLSAASAIGGMYAIARDPPSQETDRRVDWLGSALVTTGLTLIIFVLAQGEIAQPKQWATGYIIALLILGVFLVGVFLMWQRHLEHLHDDPNARHSVWTPPPLMRLSLWTRARGRYAVQMAIAFLTWCSFLSWVFWAQLYYQEYLGYKPFVAAIRFIPMTVTGILCNVFVAFVVSRVSIVWLMTFGTLITSAASLLFANIIPSAPYWAFGFPASICCVFGADFVFSGGTLFVAKLSQGHEQSVSGALFQTMIQLGTSMGIAVSTVVYDRVLASRATAMGVTLNEQHSNAPRPAQLDAYHAAQWTAFAFGALAALLALLFLRGVGIVGHKRTKPVGGDVEDGGDVHDGLKSGEKGGNGLTVRSDTTLQPGSDKSGAAADERTVAETADVEAGKGS
ncbi:major facilitator superfamily domain-containing protein [Schizophyllum amplum]|uniref:Major facilitator superfamily domain-containing protein n=1 Tax=Schizophyllum amplum TaxID=97359 RepID=A0A550CJ17_9AGAR|nr:major facilitator superfamily domain-containing protein [Auriculariopsis ampla]